ncbi:putative RNA helicase [Dioscorea sansibarensis]
MTSLKRKIPESPSSDPSHPTKSQREESMPTDEPVTCLHDVSHSEGYVPSCSAAPPPVGGKEEKKPGKKFPFELVPFQAKAIKCLDNGEPVMVFAHTLAGKTVVASYAKGHSVSHLYLTDQGS